MEISLGEWEGLTWKDVHAEWEDVARRIYHDGEDLPRGESGETWAQATARMVSTIGSLELPGGDVTGVVTHGGVIRAYVGTLSGDTASTMARLATPENTSVTHVAITGQGPVLLDYSVAPHLERDAGRAATTIDATPSSIAGIPPTSTRWTGSCPCRLVTGSSRWVPGPDI